MNKVPTLEEFNNFKAKWLVNVTLGLMKKHNVSGEELLRRIPPGNFDRFLLAVWRGEHQ